MPINRTHLPHTLSVSPYLGESAYGPTYGTPVTLDAYCEPTQDVVSDGKGREVVASLFIIGAETPLVTPESKVNWNSTVYRVVQATPVYDGAVIDHQELYLVGGA